MSGTSIERATLTPHPSPFTSNPTLGPKQRRELKNASPSEIVTQLLPGNLDVIPVLSNLAVSSASRGEGIGQALCAEIEAVVKGWGYDEILLLVEQEVS